MISLLIKCEENFNYINSLLIDKYRDIFLRFYWKFNSFISLMYNKSKKKIVKKLKIVIYKIL